MKQISKNIFLHSALFLIGGLMTACETPLEKIFVELKPEKSGIDFNNQLTETEQWGYLTYYYFYNGGGVAVGDVNNDGLDDIYFSGNMVPNKLYLNRGELKFEDVSEKAEVNGDDRWLTGVTMADVNNDGWLDIYVCASGIKENARNILYINTGEIDDSGVPKFKELASEYGLDDMGYATQATFLDYDNDGDLDCYVMNHHVQFDWKGYESLANDTEARVRAKDRLYKNLWNENDETKFVDVSSEAGIDSYGYGLGVIAQDFDRDGFVDICISNDFVSPDYFYVNNGDGTFSNHLHRAFGHTATQSMGLDAGDINNDGLTDLYVLDMLPEDNYRRKMTTIDRSAELFEKNLSDGNYYQYMTNVLQLSQGLDPITNQLSFSDIGEYAGITMTDWSWGPLVADFDNDGYKDIFVTTGILRDVNYNDFWKHIKKVNGKWQVTQKEIEHLPSVPLSNYLFKNQRDFTFSNATEEYGLDQKNFSNGSAYSDFDNDGDLDLVVSNLNSNAQLFENKTIDKLKNHYITFLFKGTDDNSFGLGAKVAIETKSGAQFGELTQTRGYQSSVAPVLYFGLGKDTIVLEATIEWPNGESQYMYNLPADQKVLVRQESNENVKSKQSVPSPMLKEIAQKSGVDYKHRENTFDDYKHQYLLPQRLSTQGPALASGDINNDGFDDIFIGAAKGFESMLYIQRPNGKFDPLENIFESDSQCEDTEAIFFHANDDSYIDLYVCSGGYEKGREDDFFQDRLYINQSGNEFRRVDLPKINTSTSAVAAGDMDNDGDLDLFVGGRLVPNNYPYVPRSYMLKNDGEAKFTDITNDINKELVNPGMVTDAIWSDFDNDSIQDLIIVGDWMPIRIFKNTGTDFMELMHEDSGLNYSSGLWNCIASADLDQDGDQDYIVGNIGLNFKYKATIDKPLHIFASDFDNSGSLDIILGFSQNGKVWPVRDKRSLAQQMPSLEQEYPDYESFAKATVYDIIDHFSGRYYHREVNQMASVILENKGEEEFQIHLLPAYAQFSSVMDIVATDYNSDGNIDLILAGNQHDMEANITRLDAGKGLILKGNSDLNFETILPRTSGFFANGNTRKLAWINAPKDRRYLIVGNNNDQMGVFHFTAEDF